MNINRIKSFVTEFSIPRFIGSEGNLVTRTKLSQLCTKIAGKESVILDHFTFHNKAEKMTIALFSTIYTIVILTFLIGITNQVIATTLALLSTVWVIIFFTFWIEIFDIIGKTGKTPCANVIVKMGNPNATKKIIFTAHSDSLSSVPSGTNYFETFTFRFFKLPIITGLIIAGSTVIFPTNYLMSLILFLPALILQWNFIRKSRFENNSPGAYDNATGIATLLELMTKIKDKPVKDKEIWFGFMDAEEAGYGGSIHLSKWLSKSFEVINIDGIGSGELELEKADGPTHMPTSKILNDKILMYAKKNNVHFSQNWMPVYPGSDHVPFMKRGFQATNIGSSSLDIHSETDTIEKIDFNQFNQVIPILEDIIYE